MKANLGFSFMEASTSPTHLCPGRDKARPQHGGCVSLQGAKAAAVGQRPQLDGFVTWQDEGRRGLGDRAGCFFA